MATPAPVGVVTGVARGIGREIAKVLAVAGGIASETYVAHLAEHAQECFGRVKERSPAQT
ncbi:hypothetical protein [Streptomyces sp. NPDC007205]|uniref:hypothetical protein n=1 Tax=Streptomyces sp. NPDC007205 TaxID=3154316 RepID=UPI0033E039C8